MGINQINQTHKNGGNTSLNRRSRKALKAVKVVDCTGLWLYGFHGFTAFPIWSHLRGSNSGPLLYESIALPAELRWRKRDTRIELALQPWEGYVLPLY